MDLLERHGLLHRFPHQLDESRVDGGVGDEQVVPFDLGVQGQLVPDVLGQDLLQAPPVFLPHVHGAAGVVHLDAGLQVQQVGPEGHHRRAAAPGLHKGEGVQDEAGVAVLPQGAYLLGDLGGGQALADPVSRLDDLQGDAGGQAEAVDGEHVARQVRLLGGQLAVLLGAGQRPAQAEVDHIVTCRHKGAEVVGVLAHVDGGGAWQDFPVVVGLVDLLHMDVHVVLVVLVL